MKYACLSLLLLFLCLTCPAHATEVQEITSPGGIKAWLVEEHALPLVSVKLLFKDSGSAYDTPGKEGMIGMSSALLLEGAGDMDSHAFNEAIENKAIQLNFGTDDDVLRASMESLSEQKELAFSYLGAALTAPRFDESAIERVRAQTLSILKQEEKNPRYLLQRAWEKAAFGAHPYGRPSLGTMESVTAISRKDMTDYVAHYLARDNMLVAVVGDIAPAELGALLDKTFGKLPDHSARDIKLSDVTLPTEAKQIVIESPIPQAMVLFGTNGLRRDDPLYYAGYVMNEALGGGGALTSRLGLEIREHRGLAYAVNSSLSPEAHAAIWRGNFATRNEKTGTALGVLRDTLKDFATKGPSDKEIADAKSHLTGAFVLNLDSNSDIANFLITMQLYNLGRDYLDKRNGIINAVTKEDIRKTAKLVDPDHMITVIVGKPELKNVSEAKPKP